MERKHSKSQGDSLAYFYRYFGISVFFFYGNICITFEELESFFQTFHNSLQFTVAVGLLTPIFYTSLKCMLIFCVWVNAAGERYILLHILKRI
jgi:hypothetical protein